MAGGKVPGAVFGGGGGGGLITCWPVRKREATWVILGAAVHRHILYKMNAINDFFKKKKGRNCSGG